MSNARHAFPVSATMPAIVPEKKCPTCHAPLVVAGGLCPRCMLRSMLAHRPEGDEWAAGSGYLVLEKIGEGGMGEVFLAEQYAPLRREVAIKRLKPGLDTAEWTRRFDIEREALARLDHPHIAHVLDAGVASDGRPFYVMELIDGLPLTAFCERRQLTLDARLRLFALVCDTIQHAHQKGVIHGDIKPSNILVATGDDGAPDPRVIDFGVLRTACAMGAFGTPGYASPDATPDARSDVFSLGALLRELAANGPRWMLADVEWIVRRATADAPDARYAAASDLAAETRRVLACRPVMAAPRRVACRAKRFARRNARALTACGVAGAILLVGAGLAIRHLIIIRSARLAVAGAQKRAATEETRSRLTTELVHRLAGALAMPDAERSHHLRGAQRAPRPA
jgi:eukaryotic-like serine/threonine-protein kinase